MVLREMGSRLTAIRLGKNLTQADLAEQAGVSKRTILRLESGEVAARLSAFIRVCRALGILAQLNILLPEPGPSPVDLLRMHGKVRRRASRPRPGAADATAPWTWGTTS